MNIAFLHAIFTNGQAKRERSKTVSQLQQTRKQRKEKQQKRFISILTLDIVQIKRHRL